jgi:hypothetical protein
MFPPPTGSTLACHPEQISTQASLFRVEAVRSAPELCEGFLHYILSGLPVASKLAYESEHTRSQLPVERVECLRVTETNLFPEFVVVDQISVSTQLLVAAG